MQRQLSCWMSYIALSHHQICSLTVWHSLSLGSSLIIGITLCLVVSLDKNSSFLPEKSVSAVKLTTACMLCPLLWCVSSLMVDSSPQPFAIFPKSCSVLPCYSVKNWTSIRDTVRCFRHTIYHCITCMIYLTRVWVLAAQRICAWACILSRSAASLFIFSSGESLCWIVVVHDMFVNCCIAMLLTGATGLDMVQEALCFPDIPLPRFIQLVMCNCMVNDVWILRLCLPITGWHDW